MPSFDYKAISSSGETVSGVIEAPDRKQVVRKLFAQHYNPVSIEQSEKDASATARISSIDFYKTRTMGKVSGTFSVIYSKQKLALNFLQKLRELLISGLPMGDAVKLLSQRLSDPRQKELATTLWNSLSEGRTLASSMAQVPEVFSESTGHLIEAGEASGNLIPVLERVVAHLEESAELRSRILNSLAYPAFICVVAFGVVLFFLFFLLPKIESMLKTLGGEMPFLARMLIGGSNFAVTVGPFLLLGLVVIIVGLIQWRRTTKGRETTDYWLLRIPFVGKILLYSEIFQSSSLMATLMESGINTTETLRLTERTLNNTQMKAKFGICRQQVQEGVSLAGTFQETHFLPDIAIDILTVGENTGNIVNSFREITKMNHRDLSQTLHVLTAAISTFALIFAFLLVLAIALSIVFSVFGISSALSI